MLLFILAGQLAQLGSYLAGANMSVVMGQQDRSEGLTNILGTVSVTVM